MNFIQEFKTAMTNRSIKTYIPIIPDGSLHRFHVEGDAKGTLNGWYVLYGGELPRGAYGCWKRFPNETLKWSDKSENLMTEEEKKQYLESIEIAKERQLKAKTEAHMKAKETAKNIWNNASPACNDHPYLNKKKIKAYDIRIANDGKLIIPLLDANKTLSSLQFIFNDGSKRFLPDGAIKGCYFQIGDIGKTIRIAEGYATSATIHESTGDAVVVVFSSGNLFAAAEIIRGRHPNHEIIICADNDAFTSTGNTGVSAATKAAQTIGAKLVIPQFKDITTKPTDFNDLFLLEGMEEVERQLATASFIEKNIIPEGFFIKNNELYFQIPDSRGDFLPPIFICSKIDIVARTRDANGLNHGKLLAFKDADGKLHQWAIPMEMLASDGADYRRELLNMGVQISSGKKAREKLTDYLLKSQPQKTILCVNQLGWHNGVFVLPDGVIGAKKMDEEVLFQSTSTHINGFKMQGSIDDWRNNIAAFCVGNSRLIFVISIAFAATLIEMLNEESGGVHIKGSSSTGKSTALKLACTVWGEPARLEQWRATSNGLEGIASKHNDSLLCLDEMGQIDPKDAGEISYMLANGDGKNRSKKDGTLRAKTKWRLLFCSTGEIGLDEHISQTGKKVKAGQQVRILEIPADAGYGLGIFENLHNCVDGSEFSRHLNQQTKLYYGTPIREFLKQITARNMDQLRKNIEEVRSDFTKELSIGSADGQVKRAASRFSLIAAAGELASILGITGWQQGEATKAVKQCFKSWQSDRGGNGQYEVKQILSHIREFFQRHNSSRFASSADNMGKVINSAGFVNKSDGSFLVETEVFKKELCCGYNYKQVAKVCINKGWLIPDKDGHAASPHRMPDTKKTRRMYHFNDKVLGDENAE